MLAVLGIIVAIVFMSWSIYKGLNPIIAAVISAFIIMLSDGLPIQETWSSAMTGVGGMLGALAPIIIFGGVLGVLYAESGAATSLGMLLMIPARKCKNRTAQIVVVLTLFLLVRAIMGLSGIDANALMVPFAALGVAIFAEFNLPTRYIVCLSIVGSSIANVLPAAPNLYNTLMESCIEGYSASEAMVLRMGLVLLFIALVVLILTRNILTDLKHGIAFTEGPLAAADLSSDIKRPHWITTFIPILVIFITYNFCGFESWSSLLLGTVVAAALFGPYLPRQEGKSRFSVFLRTIDRGTMIIPLQLMTVMLASQVMALSSGLTTITDGLLSTILPAGIVLLIISILLMGFGGSAASVTIGSLCTSTFIPLGLSPLACGVIAIWSSTVFDTLPNNTGIILTCDMVGSNMKEAYPCIFKTTVLLTAGLSLLVTLLAMVGLL